MLQSRWFRESRQLEAFLEYIVRECLEGREDGLKEYLLGVSVFHRRPDYDPRHDAIVRVQASILRKKLEAYYRSDGSSDPVVIELPRGGYVPLFRHRDAVVPAPAEGRVGDRAEKREERPLHKEKFLGAFGLGCLVTAFLAAALWFASRQARPAEALYRIVDASPDDCRALWGPFFEPNSRALVGFGAPLFYGAKGLYIRDVRVNVPGHEGEGAILDLARLLRLNPVPNDDLYTGVGEASGSHLMASFFAGHGVPVRIANARSVGLSELKGHNVVIISSLRFRTLLEDLKLPVEFQFRSLMPERIVNANPLAGEQRDYVSRSGAGVSTSYALVSVWPGASRGRRIMHIGGIHTWATQAATEFLLNRERLRRLAREFERDRRTNVRGRPTPFFQVLMRVEGRGNSFQTVDYVTHHYLRIEDKPVVP